ncbi:RodZ domain-containing protein [Desulfovibrio sp. TomC]|uniref:RodZ domain-containing protein n=1 Tax=Desulfovibrio sp. TomC TaxID=1562888 RepID=UPI0005733C3C|nr:RodZ domain-containing protein [Desulfovibrio sp. TomC]KHK04063.1 hypothetical protein NY78_0505 [Desulfovibrio sp. TomC]
MDLRELGTMLREERERQGLSLDTVADKIKISRSCLAAIEEGNERALPHPVYAKGFIKNYAKILGVDQDEFTAQLSSLYQLEEPGHGRESTLNADIADEDCGCSMRSDAPRPPVKLLALGVVGLLLVVGIVWFVLRAVFSTSQGEAPDTPAALSGASAKPASPPALESAAPAPVVAPAPVLPATPPAPAVPVAVTPTVPAPPGVGPTPAEPARPAQETPQNGALTLEDKATQDIAVSGPTAPVPAVPSAPEAAPTAPAAPTQAATAATKTFTVGESGPHVVAIVANERCWLQAGADGGSMHETMLEKGDTFTGRFADYLLVRLGNAGAVEIHFDNKLYPLQAGKGSVKTLKFVAKKTDAASPAPVGAAPVTTPPPATTSAATTSAVPAVAAVPQTPVAEGTPGGKTVEVFGQDGSWVIVSPDKAPSKEIYVKKGQSISFPFNEKIEIKLGNPSSVVFRYDGKETPVSTEKGGSKIIRFP